MKRVDLLLLAAVVLLGAALRLWRLDVMPPGLYHDEAYNGLDALALRDGRSFPQYYEGWELYRLEAHAERPPQPARLPLFFEGNYGREPLHVYLMALSVTLLGATPLALRLVPALAGTVAIATTYWAALALSERRRLALLAAFFVAVLFPMVHFSRFALRGMLFVPVETLAVAFFWSGVRQHKRTTVYWTLSGVAIGGGLYIYAAARLFPLLFALFMAVWLLRDRSELRRWGPRLGLLVAAAVVTALPLLLYFWRYPYFLLFRSGYVASHGRGVVEGRPWLTRLLNGGRVVRGLFWQGEQHLRHNLPGRPFLDPVQAVLVGFGLLGLPPTAGRRKPSATLFLLLWLGVMLLPSILSGDAPHFGRLIGAGAPLAIVAAAGWERILGRWRQAKWLLAVALLLSLTLTVDAYFRRYAAQPQLASGSYQIDAGFYEPDWQLGKLMAQLAASGSVYLTPPQQQMATFYFALDGEQTLVRSYQGGGSLLPLGEAGQSVHYLVRPDEEAALQQLRDWYGTQLHEERREQIVVASASAEDSRLDEMQRVAQPIGDAITLLAYRSERRDDRLLLTLVWRAERRPAHSYTAFVHLLDPYGELLAQIDRQPDGYPTADWLAGERIVDTFELPANSDGVTLRTGFYLLPTLEQLGEPLELALDW